MNGTYKERLAEWKRKEAYIEAKYAPKGVKRVIETVFIPPPEKKPKYYRLPLYAKGRKFTPDQVKQIREEAKKMTIPQLVYKWRCGETTIRNMINRKSYKG